MGNVPMTASMHRFAEEPSRLSLLLPLTFPHQDTITCSVVLSVSARSRSHPTVSMGTKSLPVTGIEKCTAPQERRTQPGEAEIVVAPPFGINGNRKLPHFTGRTETDNPKTGSWRYPQRANLSYFVAALSEMERPQPILSEPQG